MSTSSSACSASRVIDSDKLLYSIPASFRGGFSGDEQIDVDVVYQDTHHGITPNLARATCIALHGSPGSHNDFKANHNKIHLYYRSQFQYMLPHFVSKGIRLIAINFPGHGFVEYRSIAVTILTQEKGGERLARIPCKAHAERGVGNIALVEATDSRVPHRTANDAPLIVGGSMKIRIENIQKSIRSQKKPSGKVESDI
ncbi:hypothetical protein WR25_02024 [Diploscapter pachys]|uniref:Uncharacterized protein n=1 Tax=Diploscapter pachys TaxID=2018661 RepID=A0A2A2K9I1_9BILA|nr:hypothetical protein WR25_02024 [Diploscapter pachys]